MHILEWVWRQTREGQAFRNYQQNFPFPIRTDPSMPVDEALIVTQSAAVRITGIRPQVMRTNQRSSPMTFTINGVEFRLAFQHSPLKRQPPSRFDSIPSGLTTCTIYRMGKDGEGKPRWYIRYIATVAQFGGYHRDKGRKAALQAALGEAGWGRDLRRVAWAAYTQRGEFVREVPSVSTVKAAA